MERKIKAGRLEIISIYEPDDDNTKYNSIFKEMALFYFFSKETLNSGFNDYVSTLADYNLLPDINNANTIKKIMSIREAAIDFSSKLEKEANNNLASPKRTFPFPMNILIPAKTQTALSSVKYVLETISQYKLQ